MPVEALASHVIEAPGLDKWFESAAEVGNPDALFLALKVREKISTDSSIYGKLLPNPFSSSNFFSADHLSFLSNCLKVSYIHSSIHYRHYFVLVVERNGSYAFPEYCRSQPSVSPVFTVFGLL